MSEIDELREAVRRLTDHEAIRDLFSRYAAAMDTHDWEFLGNVFAPHVVIDRTRQTFDGVIDEQWIGRDEVLATMTSAVTKHDVSQHIIANHRITVDGDQARAVAYLHSVHIPDATKPTEHDDHGAWYLVDLVRDGHGWLISRLKHTANWYAGNLRPDGPVTKADIEEVRDYLGPRP